MSVKIASLEAENVKRIKRRTDRAFAYGADCCGRLTIRGKPAYWTPLRGRWAEKGSVRQLQPETEL